MVALYYNKAKGEAMKKLHMISPEGTNDVLFGQCLRRREVEKNINEVFKRRGYNEVITPGIEYFDLFNPSIPQTQMYTTTDNKGRLVVLRPDLTLPIARLTAAKLQNLALPIRLYYNETIFRKRAEHSGRNVEIAQSGVEVLGADGIRADLEVINTALTALASSVKSFRIEIGHAGIFKKLADGMNISAETKEKIRTIIESKNYSALDDILKNIEDSPYKSAMAKLPRLFGGEEVFETAKNTCPDKEIEAILNYISSLYNALCKMGLKDKIMLDFALVQRNDYYTGVVFSAYADGIGDAVLNGGRYNNLFEKFNMDMPAIGFAINISDIANLYSLNSTDKIKEKTLIYGEDNYETDALILLNKLTKEGKNCEIALFDTLEENIAYGKNTNFNELIVVANEITYMNLGDDDT